jgi:hypothetical protein
VGRGPVAKRHQEPKGIKSQKASRAKRHQEPKGIKSQKASAKFSAGCLHI